MVPVEGVSARKEARITATPARPALAPFLAEVEARLAALLPSADSALPRLCATLALAPDAKRARPRVLHGLAPDAAFRGGLGVELAAAAELIHAGSLLHDDVIDEGTTRRGRPTAFATDGAKLAILAGDFALARALAIVTPFGVDVAAHAARTLEAMVEGVAREAAARGRAVDVEEWRAVADGKTGALFAFAAASPLLALGRPIAHVERARRAGAAFGLLFQLVDDVIDFAPGRGKDPWADLRHESPNLVVAVARGRGVAVPAPRDVDAASVARFLDAVRTRGAGDDLARIVEHALADVAAALEPGAREGQTLVDDAARLVQDALAILGRST